MSEPTHGKLATYTNHRCRCAACRAANAAYQRDARKIRVVKTHSAAGYCNGCRCVICKRAHADYQAEWMRRRAVA